MRTLGKDHKSDWKMHLNQVVHAYNCTKNDATGHAPFYLLFGRTPILPIDVMFGLNRVSDRKYVKEWASGLKEAYELAAQNARKSASRGKQNYDKCLRSAILCERDRVLVRNLSERGGPGKLRYFWEDKIHVVVQRFEDSPVYEVQPESGEGRKRVLHRNLLFQCDYLPMEGKPKIHRKRLLSMKVCDKNKGSVSKITSETDSDCSLQYHPQAQQQGKVEKSISSGTDTFILNPEAPPFKPATSGTNSSSSHVVMEPDASDHLDGLEEVDDPNESGPQAGSDLNK